MHFGLMHVNKTFQYFCITQEGVKLVCYGIILDTRRNEDAYCNDKYYNVS